MQTESNRRHTSYADAVLPLKLCMVTTYLASSLVLGVGCYFQPKHRPSAVRQRNLTETPTVGFEPTSHF